MKKQTAVEWLIEQLENNRATFFQLNKKEKRIITLAGKDVVQQAKAMEKQQIEDAWLEGNVTECDGDGFSAIIDFDDYYNETYGGEQ